MTKANPEGFNTLSPHLIVKDIATAIDFYKKAFGAEETCRLEMPGSNQAFHAGLKLGNSAFMLGAEMNNSECMSKSPDTLGGTPVTVHFYVDNVDEAFKKAVDSGAQPLMPPTDMFWGDRFSKVKDPFGHEWSLATHVRTLSPEEMQAAAAECFKQPQPVS